MSTLLAGAAVFGSTTKTTYVLARAVEYAGTTLFYGGLAFVSLLWPDGARVRAVRVLLVTSWALGVVATLCAIGLEGAWAQQLPVSAAARGSVLTRVLNSDFGRQWSASALLWLLALVALSDLLRRGAAAVGSLPWRVGAGAVALGTLRIFGLSGHSRDTSDPVIAQLADIVHLTALSLWIGGLAMLLVGVLPRRNPDELRRVVPRYSTLAMASVAIIVASGSVLAWQVVGTVGAVTGTTYGHILLVKLGLLVLVLLAAYGSKTWVRHRLDHAVVLRGEAGLVRPFALSVAAETTLVLLVLAVASVLVTADPGR